MKVRITYRSWLPVRDSRQLRSPKEVRDDEIKEAIGEMLIANWRLRQIVSRGPVATQSARATKFGITCPRSKPGCDERVVPQDLAEFKSWKLAIRPNAVVYAFEETAPMATPTRAG